VEDFLIASFQTEEKVNVTFLFIARKLNKLNQSVTRHLFVRHFKFYHDGYYL